MRSIGEQLSVIEQRKGSLLRARAKRASAAAATACLCAIAALSTFVSGIGTIDAELPEGLSYGSLVASGPLLSYFIVGFIAFLLGITFTMLCIHVNRRDRK